MAMHTPPPGWPQQPARRPLGAGAIIAIIAAAVLVVGIIAVGANLLLTGRSSGGDPPSSDDQSTEATVTYGPQIPADGSGEIVDSNGNVIGTLSILSVAEGPPSGPEGICSASMGNIFFTFEVQLTAADDAVGFSPDLMTMLSDDGFSTADGVSGTAECLDEDMRVPDSVAPGETVTGLVVIGGSEDWHLLQYGDVSAGTPADAPNTFWWDLDDFDIQPAPDPNAGMELQPRGPGEPAQLHVEGGEVIAEITFLSATDSFAVSPEAAPQCTPADGYVNYFVEVQVTAVAEWGDYWLGSDQFASRFPDSETYNDDAILGTGWCLSGDQYLPGELAVGESATGYLVFQVPLGSTQIDFNPGLRPPVPNNYYTWDLNDFL